MAAPERTDGPDLFGEAPRPAGARKKRPPASDGSVERCRTRYVERFEARWATRPMINFGKDGKHLKAMIATWGEPTVLGLIDRFFETTHPRVVRSDYGIGALVVLAQTLLLEEQRVTDERTLGNIDAATRAARRRE